MAKEPDVWSVGERGVLELKSVGCVGLKVCGVLWRGYWGKTVWCGGRGRGVIGVKSVWCGGRGRGVIGVKSGWCGGRGRGVIGVKSGWCGGRGRGLLGLRVVRCYTYIICLEGSEGSDVITIESLGT